MSKKQVLIEGLPKPGEPLTRDIGERNQEIVERTIEERIELMRGKLEERTHRRLVRRWHQLARQMRRARYNELIRARWAAMERYTTLRAELESPDADIESVKAEGRAVVARGRALNDQIARFDAEFADEFRNVNSRLAAHDDVLKFEQQEREDRAAFYREKRTWEEQIKSVFRQSPRLHWLGKNRRGKEVMKIPKIDHVFIKGDSLYFRIKTSYQNPIMRLFGKYNSALPYGVDIDALTDEKTLKNLEAATGRKVEIVTGKRTASLMYRISRLDFADGIPEKILYGKVVDWYPEDEHDQGKTPWFGGVNGDLKVETFNFEEHPHILIAGSTQSGKSNHINQMIATLVTMNRPDQVQLVLIDNKGGIEFTHWADISHALVPMIKSTSMVLPILGQIRDYMERRLASFERMKAKNLLEYNRRVSVPIPRIIVLIDEMATLLGLDETDQIHSQLRALVSQGRAVGIHIIICTQHVSVDVLPGWIKTNMTLRISGKMPSDSASRVILDTGTAVTLPAVAGRLVISQGRIETIVQSPLISNEEIAKAVEVSREMLPWSGRQEFTSGAPLAAIEKFNRADLLALAVELGGSLHGERIHEAAGGNDVVTLRQVRAMIDDIKQLKSIEHAGKEYVIEKKGKGFKLIERPSEHESGAAA